VYTTVEALREEGVTPFEADDSRLEALIEEASELIDRLTGQFFEPRKQVRRFNGSGSHTLFLPVPLLEPLSLSVNSAVISGTLSELFHPLGPVLEGEDPYTLIFLGNAKFPEGRKNIAIEGWWGYRLPDSTEPRFGKVPSQIKRACQLLVIRSLARLADEGSDNIETQVRLIEERTRDQSYKLAPAKAGPLTGDRAIDRKLLAFRRPLTMGAA